jgi:hypothetical protein
MKRKGEKAAACECASGQMLSWSRRVHGCADAGQCAPAWEIGIASLASMHPNDIHLPIARDT